MLFVSICRHLYPLCVQVIDSLGDGVKHSAGLSLRKELLFEDPIQQLSTAHQLRHQEHLLTVIVHLRQKHTHTHYCIINADNKPS